MILFLFILIVIIEKPCNSIKRTLKAQIYQQIWFLSRITGNRNSVFNYKVFPACKDIHHLQDYNLMYFYIAFTLDSHPQGLSVRKRGKIRMMIADEQINIYN